MYRISILLALFPLLVLGQEQPTYEKKIYLSPDNKLYIQDDLPVYLWLSTSPDENSEKHRLISEETAEYANPMYWDLEGYNTVRSPSAVDPKTKKPVYPQRDIVFEVYADGSAPLTKISYGKSKTYKVDGKIYVNRDAVIQLSAKDNLSGVENIYYSMDGSAYKPYTDSLLLTQEKEYHLKYYSVDHVGNVEELQDFTIIYDKTAPVTKLSIDIDQHENVISGRSKIELQSSDVGVGLQKIIYQINNGPERTYSVPIRASQLSQGEYKIKYYGVDKVNNLEKEQEFVFYVDKSPPTIIEEVIGKSFFSKGKEYSSGKSRLKLTAFDNKAGVKEIRYSINGEEFQTYEKPVFLTQASGNLMIKTYAVDHVNNKSQSQTANDKTTIPYIDLTGPKLSQAYTGPKFTTRDTMFINNKTKIILKAIDVESGVNRIEYRVGDGEINTYKEPFQVVDEGVHLVSFTGYDNVENTSTSQFFFKVDTTGPSIQSTFSTTATGTKKVESTEINAYPSHVILFLSGTDQVVGLSKITYQLNTLPVKTYASPISGFSKGDKTVEVTATDKLGNKTQKTFNFTIE